MAHTIFLKCYLLSLNQIDVVNVCVPNYLHAQVTINAAKLDKHAVCDINLGLGAYIIDSLNPHNRVF